MKTVKKEHLIEAGYLTIEEFMVKITNGMEDYLNQNWGTRNKDEVFHPEDLSSAALCYMEVAHNVIGNFGVRCGKEH